MLVQFISSNKYTGEEIVPFRGNVVELNFLQLFVNTIIYVSIF